MKRNHATFRVNTVQLLQEVTLISSNQAGGVLKVPLNVFKNLLAQVADRCAKINDPVLNKLMFDLTLYELPSPTTPEYGKLMTRLYNAADRQLKKEALKK